MVFFFPGLDSNLPFFKAGYCFALYLEEGAAGVGVGWSAEMGVLLLWYRTVREKINKKDE